MKRRLKKRKKGIAIGDELAMDFKVITAPGAERIIRLTFDYAKKNGRKKVTIVTKANVIKKSDALFLDIAERVAKDYPDSRRCWYSRLCKCWKEVCNV